MAIHYAGGEAVRDRLRFFMMCVSTVVLCGTAALLTAESAAAGTLSSLPKGAAIDLRSCTYGPGETHAGQMSGQYLVDRNAFYGIVFLPTDIPGGHFEFRGVYPHARWFSFESYDEGLASEDVADDSILDPDPGSVNPFAVGQRYAAGRANYSMSIYSVPPNERPSPHPHNVLYMGYRENPVYGRVEHSPYSPILYRVYVGQGSYQGGVPLPHLYWVVDDPQTNPFQDEEEVCGAMDADGRVPNSAILQLNEILNDRFTQPTLSPEERNFDVPTDEVPTNPPEVNVIRPASNGYQGAYFNSRTPYVYIRPYAQYGRFLVVHFKAPTFERIEDGIPATGQEQTAYWSWCDAQFVSPVNITQACLMDKQFHLDDGYATLVISTPGQRPVINGTPYPDWMPWPGGGADLNMREIDPNPVTFPQSPFFIPLLNANDGLDYLRGVVFEQQIKNWMGPYFPDVTYCTAPQFDKDGCGWPGALQFAAPAASSAPRSVAPRPRRQQAALRIVAACRRGGVALTLAGASVRSVRRVTYRLGSKRLGTSARRPFMQRVSLGARRRYRVEARAQLLGGLVRSLTATVTGCRA